MLNIILMTFLVVGMVAVLFILDVFVDILLDWLLYNKKCDCENCNGMDQYQS